MAFRDEGTQDLMPEVNYYLETKWQCDAYRRKTSKKDKTFKSKSGKGKILV